MKSVEVRNIVIGEGIPKVCIPAAAASAEEICEQAREAVSQAADLLEWRADWYDEVFSPDAVSGVLKELRGILGDIPLLMTFRTAAEGGMKEAAGADYERLITGAAETGLIDIADIELSAGEDTFRRVVGTLHSCGVKALGSSHDFSGTPDRDEILSRLLRIQELGADILKIAVMPQCEDDVLTLLGASAEMKNRPGTQPVIAISMSRTGVVSRIAAETFGSAVTFGAAARASAPGQINAAELKRMLKVLHEDS